MRYRRSHPGLLQIDSIPKIKTTYSPLGSTVVVLFFYSLLSYKQGIMISTPEPQKNQT